MPDRSIQDVDPRFVPLVNAILNKANASIQPSRAVLTVTWRSDADQDRAARVGLSNATAGLSPHNCISSDGKPCARAVDFAIIDPHGNYVADGSDSRYATVGALAVSCGAEWGGNWTIENDGCNPDFDHIQMKNWREVSKFTPQTSNVD